MPWIATDRLEERTKFLLEWERRWKEAEGGPVNLAELCRMFGISRPTGYSWVDRYRAASFELLTAVQERSRKPKTSQTALSDEMADLIVQARKQHPKWGVLKRRGMTTPRRRRRPNSAGVAAPFGECGAPNDVWCIDFKGWFETGDGLRCYPLTLMDAYSRFLLRCEALLEPDGKHVRSVLDSAFREFGVPAAIRSDGGPPFAQQRRFDLYRREYNHERPHSALTLERRHRSGNVFGSWESPTAGNGAERATPRRSRCRRAL
jgi:transposase InsO family protein